MLIILPSAVLFAAALLVVVQGRVRSRLGTLWIILAGVAYLVWVGVVLLRLRFPGALEISNWLPGMISQDRLGFEFSPASWFIAINWLALLVCVVFANSALLEDRNSVFILAGSFGISALTLVSLISTSLLSFVITWTMIDFMEFVLLVRVIPEKQTVGKELISLTFRSAGTFLVIAALALSSGSGANASIGSANGFVYTLLILGAGLRMGVLPLHGTFIPEETVRRTMGSLSRLAAPISAFALLTQLPSFQGGAGQFPAIAIGAGIAAIFGAIMWATSLNDLNGRQYFVLALAGIGILSAIDGQPEFVVAVAGILVTVGGFLFTYPLKERRLLPAFVLLLLSVFGFPLTPYTGLWNGNWSVTRLVQLLAMAVVIFGVLRHYSKKENATADEETWITFFTRSGLIVLAVSPWLSLVWSKELISLKPGWWYSVILSAIVLAGFFYRIYFSSRLNKADRAMQFIRDIAVVGAKTLRNVLKFDWFFGVFSWFYKQLQQMIQFFESILEGEGGVLWSLVFLAILISVLASAGK